MKHLLITTIATVLLVDYVALIGDENNPLITGSIVEKALRYAIKKPTGKLNQADLDKEVWRLDFRGASRTDSGFKEVLKIKRGKNLLFNNHSRITDAGLKEVAKLKHLEGLSLMQTEITDAGIKEIAKLRKINGLNFQNTKVSSVGVARLQKAPPKCRILCKS